MYKEMIIYSDTIKWILSDLVSWECWLECIKNNLDKLLGNTIKCDYIISWNKVSWYLILNYNLDKNYNKLILKISFKFDSSEDFSYEKAINIDNYIWLNIKQIIDKFLTEIVPEYFSSIYNFNNLEEIKVELLRNTNNTTTTNNNDDDNHDNYLYCSFLEEDNNMEELDECNYDDSCGKWIGYGAATTIYIDAKNLKECLKKWTNFFDSAQLTLRIDEFSNGDYEEGYSSETIYIQIERNDNKVVISWYSLDETNKIKEITVEIDENNLDKTVFDIIISTQEIVNSILGSDYTNGCSYGSDLIKEK